MNYFIEHFYKPLFKRFPDPVYGCEVYKSIGCCFVDGFLCEFPNCSILKEYKDA